jgi:predicted deacetylase
MKKINIFIIIIITLIIALFIIRLISPTQIDDVHPEIPCPELETYNPDILYIIPNYNDKPISENQTFCQEILSLNKTLQLHGINHSPYREFLTENISQEKIEFAINEFQKCFNQTPEKFKPPQLKISPENKKIIQGNNLTINNWFNQLTHKVYHCNDEGIIKNKWIKLF